MKILLIALFSLLAISAPAMNGPIGRSTNLEIDGTITNGTLPQYFENYINRDGSTTAIGSVMCLSLVEDDGASIVSCPAVAGGTPICVLAVACADDAACKCQYYGLNASVLFDATSFAASAGLQVFISESNAGQVQAETLLSIVASDIPLGVFYDNEALSGSVEIFIKLR